VKVAKSQKNTMQLGGNLPDSLQQYLLVGSNHTNEQPSPQKKEKEEEGEVVEEGKETVKVGS
jgi:hypothetical protein